LDTITKKLYEAMFLVDSSKAASDWDGVQTGIKNILERVDAEIVSVRKWDERRLAYDINGHSRGTYILCYFRADGKGIRDIERAAQLSEQIMRVLILSAEGREKDIEEDTPVMPAEADKHQGAQEVRQGCRCTFRTAGERRN
jgi:small subunit ribosomal protein S6